MAVRARRFLIGLAVAFGLVGMTRPAFSQVMLDNDPFRSGMQAPRMPEAGDWAEVVTVTPKWMVLQNQDGQQFPVSLDSVNQFMIRWPIDPRRISPNALVEAFGLDLGNNSIRTDHVDVFEGGARSMVRPMVQQVIGFNRRPTEFDRQNKNIYGVFIPLLPGEEQIPDRLHVVGPVAALDPLRIAVGGNNAVAVFPADNGFFFSQVTAGSSTYLRAGDLVYVVPSNMTPRSLILSEMVAYKKMTFQEFVP